MIDTSLSRTGRRREEVIDASLVLQISFTATISFYNFRKLTGDIISNKDEKKKRSQPKTIKMSLFYTHTPLQNNGIMQDRSIKFAAASDNSSYSLASHKARIEFPWKLHQLLEDAEQNIIDREIVSWLPGGAAFKIHSKSKFSSEVMPLYFKTTTYKSFHRNLNMWGFETRRQGGHKGACYNSFFRRDHPDGCYLMKRTKTTKDSGTPERRASISSVTGMIRRESSITTNPVSCKKDPACQLPLPLAPMSRGSPASGTVNQGALLQFSARSHAELAGRSTSLGPLPEWRHQIAQASSSQTWTTQAAQLISLSNLQNSRGQINDFFLAATLDVLCGRSAFQSHPSAW
jgi:HSF-type DNA-binding